MKLKLQICAWSGVVGMILIFAAMWPLWHMLPPISPLLTMSETADHYRQYSMGILVGAVIQMTGVCLLVVFSGGLIACMKTIEGRFSPFTYGFVLLTSLVYFTVFVPGVIFSCLAYRPDWPDEVVRILSDLALIIYVWPGVLGTIAFLLPGLIILGDRRPQPVFPRWIGYLTLWVAILLAPGNAVTFFKSGPFAWNGLIAFWIPAVAFGGLINVLAWAMIRANTHPAIAEDQA
jgi:hypothetical protein